MKTKLFASKQLLSCFNVESIKPKFAYAWSEVNAFSGPNEHLEGWPNKNADDYKDKDGKQTENPETAQGRNIVRGQAVMYLKKFAYESGEDNETNPSSKHLNDLIAASRRAELGMKEPDGKTVLDKKDAANNLKTALDNFRSKVTQVNAASGKLDWKAPSKLDENFSDIASLPEGRNWLRSEAAKYKADPAVNAALIKSTKTETGQWKVENPGDATTAKDAAEELRQALIAKKGGSPLPAPAPAPRTTPPAGPGTTPGPSPEKQKEDAAKPHLDEANRQNGLAKQKESAAKTALDKVKSLTKKAEAKKEADKAKTAATEARTAAEAAKKAAEAAIAKAPDAKNTKAASEAAAAANISANNAEGFASDAEKLADEKEKPIATEIERSMVALEKAGFTLIYRSESYQDPNDNFDNPVNAVYAQLGEQRVWILPHANGKYQYKFVSAAKGSEKEGDQKNAEEIKKEIEGAANDKVKMYENDLRYLPNQFFGDISQNPSLKVQVGLEKNDVKLDNLAVNKEKYKDAKGEHDYPVNYYRLTLKNCKAKVKNAQGTEEIKDVPEVKIILAIDAQIGYKDLKTEKGTNLGIPNTENAAEIATAGIEKTALEK